MAREAYRSLYGDLAKLKDTSLLGITATSDDPELWQLLMHVSEQVERYCDRHFVPITTTRELDGNGDATLPLPDVLAITTLKEDTTQNGTYDTTWASTDYELYPRSAEPTKHWGHAYTRLRVTKSPEGTKSLFTKGQANFELAGRFGFRELKEDSGSNVTVDSPLSATAVTVNVTAGTDFAIGQTILIESEQMLVTAIASNALTVTRALNGTTAATHNLATDVYILRWPGPVERATLIQAARLWHRAPAFEPFYVDAALDTDVRELLDPYRRLPT